MVCNYVMQISRHLLEKELEDHVAVQALSLEEI